MKLKLFFVALGRTLILTGAVTLFQLVEPVKTADWAKAWIVAVLGLGQLAVAWLCHRGAQRAEAEAKEKKKI